MKNPHLLSPNDYKRISKALDAHKEDIFTMTLADYSITIHVSPLGGAMAVWNQSMCITVRQSWRNVDTIQHFRSVKEMRCFLG